MQKTLIPFTIRRILVTACLLWAGGPARAQWSPVSGVPARPIVAPGALGDTLIAASDNGQVYRSIDGGTNWSAVALNEPSAVGISLTIPDDTLYHGTLDNGLFRSSDRGTSWLSMGPGLLLPVTDVVRFNGVLYASTDGAGVRRYDPASGSWLAFNSGLPTDSYNASTILRVGNQLMIGAGGNGTYYTYYTYDFAAGAWTERYYYGTLLPGFDVNEILYALNRNRILRSTDVGQTWTDDAVGTRNGADRWIHAGADLLYTLTNLGNNTCCIEQRNRNVDVGSNWSSNEELVNGYAFDLLETSGRLYLAKEDSLFTRQRGGVHCVQHAALRETPGLRPFRSTPLRNLHHPLALHVSVHPPARLVSSLPQQRRQDLPHAQSRGTMNPPALKLWLASLAARIKHQIPSVSVTHLATPFPRPSPLVPRPS